MTNKGVVFAVVCLAVGLLVFSTMTPKGGMIGGLRTATFKPPAADRDTAADSLTTITAQTRETRKLVDSEREQRQRLKEEIKGEYQEILSALKVSAETARLEAAKTKQVFTGEIKNLQRRLVQAEDKVRERPPSPVAVLPKVPVGEGIKPKKPPAGYRWIAPIDQAMVKKVATNQSVIRSGSLLPAPGALGRRLGAADGRVLSTATEQGLGEPPSLSSTPSNTNRAEPNVIPSYTIPENATLMGARAMSGLFGRIPMSGQIRDALPFRIITGADNLASQGFDIPDLERAVWSGVAIGDRTLRCVEGRLASVTFVFTDGTIRTVRGSTGKPLGYLFDDHGYPCIPGTYVTDAPRHIAGIAAVGAAMGAADAIADKEVTRYGGRDGTTEYVTGDTSRFIAGTAAEDAFGEVAGVLRDRLKETFDAVIVQPGETVALAISTEIRIDYDVSGRRIDYAAPRLDATAPLGVQVKGEAAPASAPYVWRSPTTLADADATAGDARDVAQGGDTR